MGDFGADTAVEGGDGRYRARISKEWEIWGPNGGYVAAIALRAAGAHAGFRRPATFAGHYLSVAGFDEVELEVTTLRKAKRAESVRVSMTQGDRSIMEAIVWAVDEGLPGLEHDTSRAPEVPPPSALKSWEELRPEKPPYKFWENIECRPTEWYERWEDRPPAPTFTQWCRYRPRATFEDPYTDAGRYLLLIDTFLWPAAVGAYSRSGPLAYIAPSLDIAVSFHRLDAGSEWLYCEAESPIAEEGLIGGGARVWSEDGRLLASGGGQMLSRPVAPPS